MKQKLVRNIWLECLRHCLVECKLRRLKYSCRMKKENYLTHFRVRSPFKIRITNFCLIFVKVKLEWLQAYKETTNILNWNIDLNRSKTWVSFLKTNFLCRVQISMKKYFGNLRGLIFPGIFKLLEKKKCAVKNEQNHNRKDE